MVEKELESRLRNEFRRKVKNVAFQKIVDIAIDACEKCDAKTRDGKIINEFIPRWIQSNYKLVINDDMKIIDTDKLYNEKLLEKNADILKVGKDAKELIDHLDYINYLRKQKALKIKEPVKPTGVVPMEEYTNYLKALRECRDYEQELEDYIKIVDKFLSTSELPMELKRQLRAQNYEIKSKELRIFLNSINKEFINFILFEKYGRIEDNFYKKKDGVKQMIRSPTIILENLNENPSIDLSVFLLNCIKVDKRLFQQFYNLLKMKKHIKIITMGELKSKVYFVYDYLAPKKWFKEEFFQSVEQKLDERPLQIDEELYVEYDFPYYSFWKIQQKFTYNFMIFMNKNNLLGLSERKIPIQKLPSYIRMDKRFSNYGYLFATVNPYQIYYPTQKYINTKENITKEEKRLEYFKIYSCFHGKNIFKQQCFESGDYRMDNFILEMELMSGKLQEYIDTGIKNRLSRFVDDVVENYKHANSKKDLILFLKELKEKYKTKNVRVLKRLQRLKMLKLDCKKYHGNSKQAKKIKTLIKVFNPPTDEEINEIKDKIESYRGLIHEIKMNSLNKQEKAFKHLIYDFAEEYCEEKYYRKIIVHRDIVSYAKTMANNLNISGVVRVYKKKTGDFLHKFTHQFQQIECDIFPDYNTLSKKEISISCLLKALMEIAIRGNMSSTFNDLFDLLYNLELENKEKKLLEELKI